MKFLFKSFFWMLFVFLLINCSGSEKENIQSGKAVEKRITEIMHNYGIEDVNITFGDIPGEADMIGNFETEEDFKAFLEDFHGKYGDLKRQINHSNKVMKMRYERFQKELELAQTEKDRFRVGFKYPDIVVFKNWEKVKELGLIPEAIEAGIYVPEEYH